MNKLLFFSLYFSQGAPIGFIWWALPAILASENYNISDIATISALATLPWTLKVLIAPFIDLLHFKNITLKKQLIVYQLLMGVTLLLIPEAISTRNQTQIITVLVIHGFFAAAQDICIDALAIKTIPFEHLGKINGVMQTGMLVGRSFIGGAGVYLAYKLGLHVLIALLIVCIFSSMYYLSKQKFTYPEAPHLTAQKYMRDFRKVVLSRSFLNFVAITFFSALSYNGISTVASAAMVNKGMPANWHGIIYSVFIPMSMALGAIWSGKKSDSSLKTSTLKLCLACSIFSSILVGVVLDYTNIHILLVVTYMIFYVSIGSTTVALYSLLMKNTSTKFAALEFSAFMGITNLSDMCASYMTGQLVEQFNYSLATVLIGSTCSISYLFLKNIRS